MEGTVKGIKKTVLTVFFLCSALMLVYSCVMAPPPRAPEPYAPQRTVAVLPIYNATNDVDGPKMLRDMVAERLRRQNYIVKPIGEVDAILMDQMGITLGSQLDLAASEKIGAALGVERLVYGYLLNFEEVTTGVYNVKKVRLGLRLVDASTGALIWARGQGVKAELTSAGLLGKGVALAKDIQEAREGIEPFKSIPGIAEIQGITDWQIIRAGSEDSVGDAALKSLGTKLLTKAIGIHLKAESEAMLNMIFHGFFERPIERPARPRHPDAPPPHYRRP